MQQNSDFEKALAEKLSQTAPPKQVMSPTPNLKQVIIKYIDKKNGEEVLYGVQNVKLECGYFFITLAGDVIISRNANLIKGVDIEPQQML